MLIIGNAHISPGFKGTDALLKGAQLPSTKEVIRQAAVAKEKNQSSEPDPHATERPAAYGVASQAETHTDNHPRREERHQEREPAYRADDRLREKRSTEDSSSDTHQVDTTA